MSDQKVLHVSGSATAPPVPSTVEESRRLLRPRMEEALQALHPDLARACRYYLGWCNLDGTATTQRSSRGLQATLVLLSAEAAGATPERGLPAAVAMEFVHNAFLMHDDLMDKDAVRRGRPTVWAALGTPASLLSGDALWAAACEALLALPQPQGQIAMRELNRAIARLVRAAAAEFNFESRSAQDITLEESQLALCDLGGALLGCAASLGVFLAEGPESLVITLRSAAEHAGFAWQATNYTEDLWNNEALVGKPGYNDLRLRKKTIPLLAALRSGTPAGAKLQSLWDQPTFEESDLPFLAGLIEEAGGRAYTENLARTHLDQALDLVAKATVAEDCRDRLGTLLHFVVTRQASRAT
ncbi:polyprenyl synthetase family protein [Streptomyces sp. NPDC001667]